MAHAAADMKIDEKETEKPVGECVEHGIADDNDNNNIAATPPRDLTKVVRKLDLHLMPLCFILYTFSVLDRSNLGNARLAGLEDDLDLSGDQYEWLGTAYVDLHINSFKHART